MRILLLNWRDVKSPRAGGAERVTHELARRLVARGDEIVWLTSSASGLPAEEELDGIRVVRHGSELTTRVHAPRLERRGRFDLVLEEINTLPYLAPLWSRSPVLLFMHQLAREVWWYEAPKSLGAIGYVLEPLYLRAYRRTPAVTVSRSTADDLRALGHRAQITIVRNAVETTRVGDLRPKLREGALVAVGRLTPSKRVDHAIEALAELRRTHPHASLTVVGDGPDRPRLEALARERGVADRVMFAGRVDETEKERLLEGADVLVGTSVREGWGLTVTEAACRGTPSVVYDIPGFRDAVTDQRTGLLSAPEPAALAARVRELLADPARYEQVRRAAWQPLEVATWDDSGAAFARVVDAAAAASSARRLSE